MDQRDFHLQREVQYTNGYQPKTQPIQLPPAKGCDKQSVGKGWGIALTVIGSVAFIAGAALLTTSILKIKAIPLNGPAGIGVGAGVLVLGSVGFGSGIYLINKSYWKDPIYADKVRQEVLSPAVKFEDVMKYPKNVRRLIISEKSLCTKFLEYIQRSHFSYEQAVRQFNTRNNNEWNVVFGEEGFVNIKVLQEIANSEIQAQCKTNGYVDPAKVSKYFDTSHPENLGIILQETHKKDALVLAKNYTYAQMKAHLNSSITNSEKAELLKQQFIDCKRDFQKFYQKHSQGIWEMITDGVLPINQSSKELSVQELQAALTTQESRSSISDICRKYGSAPFYLQKNVNNGSLSNPNWNLLREPIWKEKMQSQMGSTSFTELVKAFGGRPQDGNWAYLEGIICAELAPTLYYTNLIMAEIRDQTFAEIISNFTDKIFTRQFISYNEGIILEKFKSEVEKIGIKNAIQAYPQLFFKILDPNKNFDDIKNLIVNEIKKNPSLTYPNLEAHFGTKIDIFCYVDNENCIRDLFENYLRNEEFCSVWDNYRANGLKQLSPEWLAAIKGDNGFDSRLSKAKEIHRTEKSSAENYFKTVTQNACRTRDAQITTLEQRKATAEAQIERENKIHNNAMVDFKNKQSANRDKFREEFTRIEEKCDSDISIIFSRVAQLDRELHTVTGLISNLNNRLRHHIPHPQMIRVKQELELNEEKLRDIRNELDALNHPRSIAIRNGKKNELIRQKDTQLYHLQYYKYGPLMNKVAEELEVEKKRHHDLMPILKAALTTTQTNLLRGTQIENEKCSKIEREEQLSLESKLSKAQEILNSARQGINTNFSLFLARLGTVVHSAPSVSTPQSSYVPIPISPVISNVATNSNPYQAQDVVYNSPPGKDFNPYPADL